VQRGHTLEAIAHRYHVDAVPVANGIDDPRTLHPRTRQAGQEIIGLPSYIPTYARRIAPFI
jgi:hypothetical protein